MVKGTREEEEEVFFPRVVFVVFVRVLEGDYNLVVVDDSVYCWLVIH